VRYPALVQSAREGRRPRNHISVGDRPAPAELPSRGRHFSKRACKPNSVVCGHSSRRRVAADVHQRPTRRFRHLLEPPVAYRADTPRRPVLQAVASPSLFGLAPCGVYPARCLTAAAVRSYRTFSPLPRRERSKLLPGCLRRPGKGRKRVTEAVYSLWHWPSRSLNAAIPDVIRHTALRSSDFPPPKHSLALWLAKLRQRPHGSLAIVILPCWKICRAFTARRYSRQRASSTHPVFPVHTPDVPPCNPEEPSSTHLDASSKSHAPRLVAWPHKPC
jgi:hypothetical protein